MAGVFVAGGHDGLRMISADGVKWDHVEKGREGEVFHTAAFGAGGVLLAGRFGGSNLFAFSRDGVTWKQYLREAQYSRYLQGLLYARGEFLALGGDPVTVGASRPFLFRSRDGENWTDNQPIGGKNVLRRVAWNGSRFVAVGDRGRRAYSDDSAAWQDVPGTRAVDTLVDIAWGAGVFVGVGLHGLRLTSRDGVTWDGRYPGEEGEHLNRILWTGREFVAIGQGATYFSPDGTRWERRPNTNAPLTAAYGSGFYVGANWKGRVLKSADAVTWETVFKADTHVEAVAFGSLAAGRP